ncbi:MAG TPA: alpha/beta hydrolase [Tepidisphaeraceae bacterium]|nr:alpha/beta hydrolase [Tepidisphaeraceae bacterium]
MKRHCHLIACLVALCVFTAPAFAQTTQPVASVTVEVWPEGKMPGHGANDPEQDRPAKSDHVRRITDISRPTLSVFPAPGKPAAAPAVIVCPGGGYSYVVFDKEGTEIAQWLNSNGVAAIVLKYRTPHNRDGAFQDVQRAVSLTRAHAAEWNIVPNRVGVIGFSAGGNLAAKASTDFEPRTYAPIDAVDQLSCRPDFAILIYPAYLAQKDGTLAADLNLKAKIPPTLIVHSEDDKTFVAGSKAYHAALDDAKIPNEFLLYHTGGHGYGLRCTLEAKAWPKAALAWLQRIGVR